MMLYKLYKSALMMEFNYNVHFLSSCKSSLTIINQEDKMKEVVTVLVVRKIY